MRSVLPSRQGAFKFLHLYPNLIIDQATSSCISKIVELQNQVVTDSGFLTPTTEKKVSDKMEYLQGDLGCYLVAFSGGALIGYARMELEKGETDTVTLAMLAVSEKHKGNGIGTKLYDVCHEWAIAFNYKRLRIQVDKRNARALKLYKFWGFTVTQEKPNYYELEKDL